MNNESDVIHVDPHITHYIVYTIDVQYNRQMVRRVDRTETSFTLNDIQNDDLCPMYQVSAWNAGGEGELSDPVQPHSKLPFFHILVKCTVVFELL